MFQNWRKCKAKERMDKQKRQNLEKKLEPIAISEEKKVESMLQVENVDKDKQK
jgi:hypothetical protein